MFILRSCLKTIKPLLQLVACVLILIVVASQPAAALTFEAIQAANNGKAWYDPRDTTTFCGLGTATAASSLDGNDNQQKAYNYFINKGLLQNQAAAAVGNMMRESRLVPTVMEIGGNSQNPRDAGSKGWGIIQWTPGSKAITVAAQANITSPIYELSTQLDMVWWHMTNTSPTGVQNMAEGFKQTLTLSDAVNYFEEKVEGASIKALSERLRFAQDTIDKYGDKTTPIASVGDSGDAFNCPTATGSGQNTQFIDGFTIYSQYDPAWINKPYGSSTIGPSGCGPTALAMIVTNLLGRPVLPDEVAAYAASKGMYQPGAGSSWAIATVVAQRYGLKATLLGTSVGRITETLQAGGLVTAPGDGALPFTTGGHYIVIRGVTASGKWKIGDSAHKDVNDKEWDPAQLISQMHSGGVYAISK